MGVVIKQMIINPLINPQDRCTWPITKNKIVRNVYIRSTFANIVILTARADTGKYCKICEESKHYIQPTKCNTIDSNYQVNMETFSGVCPICKSDTLCRIVVYVSFLISVSSSDLSEYELYVNIDNNIKLVFDNEKRTTDMRTLPTSVSIEDIIEECKRYIENNVIYDDNLGACVEHIYMNITKT